MSILVEQDLLNGAQAGDMATLGAIYDLYSPGIYRYAMRLLGDDGLAEDCVAETFSRFLKALSTGRGPRDHLQAYLYRIAHNLITDTYRRQPPPPLDLDESLAESRRPLPEIEVDLRMEQQRVRSALRSLPADQQQVIVLRFIEGWDSDEIMAALQKTAGAVRVLQHRAISALQKLLLNDGVKGIVDEPKR